MSNIEIKQADLRSFISKLDGQNAILAREVQKIYSIAEKLSAHKVEVKVKSPRLLIFYAKTVVLALGIITAITLGTYFTSLATGDCKFINDINGKPMAFVCDIE